MAENIPTIVNQYKEKAGRLTIPEFAQKISKELRPWGTVSESAVSKWAQGKNKPEIFMLLYLRDNAYSGWVKDFAKDCLQVRKPPTNS